MNRGTCKSAAIFFWDSKITDFQTLHWILTHFVSQNTQLATCHLTELVTAATVPQNKSAITQGGNIRVLKTRPTDLHPSPHRPVRPVQRSTDPILTLPVLNITISKLLLLLRNKRNIYFLNIFHLIQKKYRSCYC